MHTDSATLHGCIMILGAPNDHDGKLSAIAEARARKGAAVFAEHPAFKILPTGGFGAHFNETAKPHWTYAKTFLIEALHVPEDAFLADAVESGNTVEDFEKARPVLVRLNPATIIIVTSAFHAPRAAYIAHKALPEFAGKITLAPAPDDTLDAAQLAHLRAHETRALDYLKANY